MAIMDHVAALVALEDVFAAFPEDMVDSPRRLVEHGYRLSGVLLVGQYVAPDGSTTTMVPMGVGNMNAWTQEGILRFCLRQIEGGAMEWPSIPDDDDDSDPSDV
jgi:hypothetical protein